MRAWASRHPVVLRALAAVVVLAGVLGGVAWYQLFRIERMPFTGDADYFAYGSIGVEPASGLPYWVWKVLPDVFPDLVGDPRGYATFGFLWEDGKTAPVGLPVETVGFPRLGINCGLCHIGSVRESEGAPRRLLIGAPASTVDAQRYFRFLFAAAGDPRFTASTLIPAIEKIHELGPLEALLLRLVVIPQMRQAVLANKAQLWWMDAAPDWGPGRVDPFNPAKVQLVGLAPDGTVGAARMAPLWNWRPRAGFGLHRDGLNTSLTEIFLNSGIGNGASNATIERDGLARLQRWVVDLPPPPYPFPIDRALAASGAPIFAEHCARCHAFGGEKTGQPIPIAWTGTDAKRWESWTPEARDGFNGLDDYSWRYTHFRKTSGYVAQALDGAWARAPYLHNGSVPNLAALLAAPPQRPVTFFAGYDVYDQARIGFVSEGADAAAQGRLFDTRLPGNGNGGHLFGVDLSEAQKHALLEYMKTL